MSKLLFYKETHFDYRRMNNIEITKFKEMILIHKRLQTHRKIKRSSSHTVWTGNFKSSNPSPTNNKKQSLNEKLQCSWMVFRLIIYRDRSNLNFLYIIRSLLLTLVNC